MIVMACTEWVRNNRIGHLMRKSHFSYFAGSWTGGWQQRALVVDPLQTEWVS